MLDTNLGEQATLFSPHVTNLTYCKKNKQI